MRDDIEFNINFCKLVEQNPALYDSTRCDSIRSVQDQIWDGIAKTLKTSVTDCRERWKNIRGRYAKVHKKMRCSPATKKVKEYYLGPHLHFLDDFINKRPHRTRKYMQRQDVTETMDADDDSSDNDNGEESNQSFSLQSSVERDTDLPQMDSEFILLPSSTEEVDNRISTYEEDNKSTLAYLTSERQAKSKDTDSSDSDFCFLKSLLPDMNEMSPAQKRLFKIRVMNLARQILDGHETVTACSSSSKF